MYYSGVNDGRSRSAYDLSTGSGSPVTLSRPKNRHDSSLCWVGAYSIPMLAPTKAPGERAGSPRSNRAEGMSGEK
jgi:hypothetical protein